MPVTKNIAICLILLVCAFPAKAQDSTSTFLSRLSDWTILYAISIDDFLQEERANFQIATGKRPYVTAILETDHWLLSRLNEVTKERYSSLNPKAFHIRLVFTSSASGKYRVQARMEDDENRDLTELENSFNDAYSTSSVEIVNAPTQLGKQISETWKAYQAMFPDPKGSSLYIRRMHDGAVFSEGEVMEIDPEFGETVEVELLNSDLQIINTDQSQWQNASPYENHAIVDLQNREEISLQASTYNRSVKILVRKKHSLMELKEKVRLLLIEILESKRKEAMARVDSLKSDSSMLLTEIRNIQDSINRANIPLVEIDGFQSAGVFSMYESPVVLTNQEEKRFYDVPQLRRGAENMKEYLIVHNNLRQQLSIIGFVNLLMDDPQKLLQLVENLLVNSGQLLGQLMTGRDHEENKTTARNIVISFVNQQLLLIAQK